MKVRYKCIVFIEGLPGPLIFKRYGETETEVRGELESFIKERYEAGCKIEHVELDKTHKVGEKKKVEKNDNGKVEEPAKENTEEAQAS